VQQARGTDAVPDHRHSRRRLGAFPFLPASDAAGVDMRAWFDRHVGGTDDMDYDEVLAAAGMKLVRDAATNAAGWHVEPLADATPAQVRIRDGWVSGKTSN